MTGTSRALAERLERVARQLRSLSEMQVRELAALGERAANLARLHADETRIALEELDDIRARLTAADPDAAAPNASAKRERWESEQERLANPPPRSRRGLLRLGEDREQDA